MHNSVFCRITLLLCAMLLVPMAAKGAPGYTYELILEGGYPDIEALNSQHLAINNNSQVVFVTTYSVPFEGLKYRVYVATVGNAPELVFESGTTHETDNVPIFDQSAAVGINDNGIVAIGLSWPTINDAGQVTATEYGYGIFEPGVGLISEIRGLRKSSGRLNNDLQMAGTVLANQVNSVVITDGTTTESTPAGTHLAALALPQLNNSGIVATSTIGPGGDKIVVWAAPPADAQSTSVGDSQGIGYTTNAITPGLNDNGWMSFVTYNDNGNLNPNPRVLLISPAGDVFVVTDAANSSFENFWPARSVFARGVGLNNNNRVSFVAETEGTNDGDEIWVGDTSGDAPRLAIETSELVELTNGQYFRPAGFGSDVSHHSTNSLNDAGEIAVIAFGILYDENEVQIQSQTRALIVARPVAGSDPGNPVIPDPADALPPETGGWRFRGRCWGEVFPCRQWIDPPIAVGYDYRIDDVSVGTFASVLIPVALPGGDTEFLVEVNGAPAQLLSGTALNFADITPGPVREFRISGIDQDENLDPDDPAAFVAGITFGEGTDENVSFTMIPVVFDPDDADGDGTPDAYDEYPDDPTRSGDPDGDGIDSNEDLDDDGDGVPDTEDDYPWGRFDDVPPGAFAFSFVETLARAGVTAGCGSGDYCPTVLVTRAQMAVFLERGKNGSSFNPPAADGTVFNDVGAGDFAAAFIEQLAADGITAGCGNNNYCPNETVNRDQMAVFLLRAKYGAAYQPPAATGVFSDVPPGRFAAAWIEQLAAEGITAGCGNGNYCPAAPVTRDQMAVFLVRTFGL